MRKLGIGLGLFGFTMLALPFSGILIQFFAGGSYPFHHGAAFMLAVVGAGCSYISFFMFID